MAKEHLLIDPHGGHNYVDDGLTSPFRMVEAAKRKGVVPAITSHNTMWGIPSYYEAMELFGMGRVRLPGVELEFRITTEGLPSAGMLSSHEQARIMVGPGKERFVKQSPTGEERNEKLTSKQVLKARYHIIGTITQLTGETPDKIIPQLRKDFWRLQFAKVIGGELQSQGELGYIVSIGLWVALEDPGFAPFWILAQERLVPTPDMSSEVRKFLDIINSSEVTKIAYLGWLYWDRDYGRNFKEENKGEIVCLMPQQRSLVIKMATLVDVWRDSNYHKSMPLEVLFDYLISNLTETEYSSLVFNLPHPISIDTTRLGLLIVHAFEGRKSLFSPEIFTPEIAEKIDTVEVYNAAHPGVANRGSFKLSEIKLFRDKPKTGASDSHHPAWVGSGATLLEVDELSTDGILDALRTGKTLPISGWGKLSRSWIPFTLWGLMVRELLPGIVLSWIEKETNLQTPALKALELNLLNEPDNTRDWVY